MMKMSTIGIICAGDSELQPYLDMLPFKESKKKAMLTFYECEYQTHRLIALYSGVCKVNGALAAQILIDGYQPDFILNGGTCGGLDENVDIFDTIVAERCIYHDVAEDILTDFHPWMKEPWFLSDEKLLRVAERAQVRRPLRFGAVATGEYFLGAGSRRERLLEKYPEVLAVDMETAAIAHACYVNQVPFLAVRTVTDNGTLPGIGAFEANVEQASAISCQVCLEIIAAYSARSCASSCRETDRNRCGIYEKTGKKQNL